MTDERQTGDTAARLVEDYIRLWLRRSEMGKGILAKHTPEDAMKYTWELLNAGFIKITSDANGFTGIRPCMPPEPPKKPLDRPGQNSFYGFPHGT